MEIADFFKELFEYNCSANKALLKLFQDHEGKISEKSIQLLNHLLNAHQIWNERILDTKNACDVWEIRPLHLLDEINETNHYQTQEILKNLTLDDVKHYKTSKGIDFSNSIRDIVFHIINHSNYHRAQIATDVKQNGIEPINTDYIFYKRK